MVARQQRKVPYLLRQQGMHYLVCLQREVNVASIKMHLLAQQRKVQALRILVLTAEE